MSSEYQESSTCIGVLERDIVDYTNWNNKSIPVLHAQGDSRFEYPDMFQFMRWKPCSVPEHIGVVTCCTKQLLDTKQSELINQLEDNKIPFVNPVAEFVGWRNSMKPLVILQGIEMLPQECTHVLQLDASDVMLNGDFVRAIPCYEQYAKPVLFGASRNRHPNCVIDKVRDRDWRGNFCYLNAGTSFGERAAMYKFYSEVAELIEDAPENEGEQILVRIVFDGCQDWVDFDWKCNVFQTFSNANVEYRDDGTIKVY